jgi:hypothetical protein
VKRDRSPLHSRRSSRCPIKHVARVSSSTAIVDAVKDVKDSSTTKGMMTSAIIKLESIEKGRVGRATLRLEKTSLTIECIG